MKEWLAVALTATAMAVYERRPVFGQIRPVDAQPSEPQNRQRIAGEFLS